MNVGEIQWSKYIPITPSVTQEAFTRLPHKDALFGGAAGGGKSYILLANALQYTHIPGYSALILRRTFVELKQAGALLDTAINWLKGQPGVSYSPEDHTYSFKTRWPKGVKLPIDPPDSKLQFGYLGEHKAEMRYQGAHYHFVGIDEASHFENDNAPLYLFSRMRKPVCPTHRLITNKETGIKEPNYVADCPICQMYQSLPLRFRLTANPGGPGHSWIKDRYRIEKEIYEDEEGSAKVRWVGKNVNAPFIPSTLRDNDYIDQTGYRDSLSNLDEITRQQLEDGDWDISPDSRFNSKWCKYYSAKGDYFQLGHKVFKLEDMLAVFQTVDPASSQKAGPIDADINPKKAPSESVISTWCITPDFNLIWLHMTHFREEIPYLMAEMKRLYKLYQVEYSSCESNGLGKGPYQILKSQGFNMRECYKTRDKIQNAQNAILRMKAGHIWFPQEAHWLKAANDQVFTWTGHPGLPDDIVDTLSDAANILTDKFKGQDPFMQDEDYSEETMPDGSPEVFQFDPSHLPTSPYLGEERYGGFNDYFN